MQALHIFHFEKCIAKVNVRVGQSRPQAIQQTDKLTLLSPLLALGQPVIYADTNNYCDQDAQYRLNNELLPKFFGVIGDQMDAAVHDATYPKKQL